MRTLLRSVAAGLVASAALTASTTTQPPTATAQSVSSMPSTYESRVLRLLNHQRALRDIRSLRGSRCVDNYAESRARRLAVNDDLVHYGGLRNVLGSCGGSSVGEIVARGRGYADAAKVVRAWMRSPDHRQVVLLKRFRQAGVGAYRSGDGTVYVSVIFRAP